MLSPMGSRLKTSQSRGFPPNSNLLLDTAPWDWSFPEKQRAPNGTRTSWCGLSSTEPLWTCHLPCWGILSPFLPLGLSMPETTYPTAPILHSCWPPGDWGVQAHSGLPWAHGEGVLLRSSAQAKQTSSVQSWLPSGANF